MDRGAWRATVHRLTKNQTRLKQLSTDTHRPYNIYNKPDRWEHIYKSISESRLIQTEYEAIGQPYSALKSWLPL